LSVTLGLWATFGESGPDQGSDRRRHGMTFALAFGDADLGVDLSMDVFENLEP
jgi:hypothetical protein